MLSVLLPFEEEELDDCDTTIPMLPIPALIAAVETTSWALGADIDVSFWFKLLVVFDLVFVTACLMVFEYVLEE